MLVFCSPRSDFSLSWVSVLLLWLIGLFRRFGSSSVLVVWFFYYLNLVYIQHMSFVRCPVKIGVDFLVFKKQKNSSGGSAGLVFFWQSPMQFAKSKLGAYCFLIFTKLHFTKHITYALTICHQMTISPKDLHTKSLPSIETCLN